MMQEQDASGPNWMAGREGGRITGNIVTGRGTFQRYGLVVQAARNVRVSGNTVNGRQQ